jgi:hypothetical protein
VPPHDKKTPIAVFESAGGFRVRRLARRRDAMKRTCFASLLVLAAAFAARADVPPRCAALIAAFGPALADVNCFESANLTTANTLTTPADNSIATLPLRAFTPVTDRGVISPALAANRTPITRVVPGVQLDARIASDPLGQARFLLRLPDAWNGRLVVAGASGTRSEFNGDFAWSDYVVQKGYAYASQNKGVLNLVLVTDSTGATYVSTTPPPFDPLACRLNPSSPLWVHFFDNDPGQQFTRWAQYMAKAAQLAREGVEAHYGKEPRYTYAVGTSNGGYQVRRAVESYPQLFDGGVDWEGTFVDEHAPNLLTDLPAAVLNFGDYVASGLSMWRNYSNSFWEVTQCQWQKRLDPGYDTYNSGGAGTGTYNYVARLSVSDVGAQLASFATTGRIQRPLITVAGTMDALLPIDHHARAYARKVAAAKHRGERDEERAPYRLYEVQNGNHIEAYKDQPQTATAAQLPQLEFIEPHAQRAFDLLVSHVEGRAELPPSQCIPRGGSISGSPAQPGHCANLFAP